MWEPWAGGPQGLAHVPGGPCQTGQLASKAWPSMARVTGVPLTGPCRETARWLSHLTSLIISANVRAFWMAQWAPNMLPMLTASPLVSSLRTLFTWAIDEPVLGQFHLFLGPIAKKKKKKHTMTKCHIMINSWAHEDYLTGSRVLLDDNTRSRKKWRAQAEPHASYLSFDCCHSLLVSLIK